MKSNSNQRSHTNISNYHSNAHIETLNVKLTFKVHLIIIAITKKQNDDNVLTEISSCSVQLNVIMSYKNLTNSTILHKAAAALLL